MILLGFAITVNSGHIFYPVQVLSVFGCFVTHPIVTVGASFYQAGTVYIALYKAILGWWIIGTAGDVLPFCFPSVFVRFGRIFMGPQSMFGGSHFEGHFLQVP